MLTKEKKVILAGRTLNNDSDAFRIVILEVDTEVEAKHFMENDPVEKMKL